MIDELVSYSDVVMHVINNPNRELNHFVITSHTVNPYIPLVN